MLFGVDSFYLRPSPLNLILRRLDQLLGNKVHLAHLGSRRASQRRIELVAELGLYACVDLMNTNKALAKIAEDVGFYDHSTFIRQFTKHMGMLPAKYRKNHRK